jgi:hypothetical protein
MQPGTYCPDCMTITDSILALSDFPSWKRTCRTSPTFMSVREISLALSPLPLVILAVVGMVRVLLSC